MNSKGKMDGSRFQFVGQRQTKMKTAQQRFARKWQEAFRRHRQMHDPMLVFNMSIFNVANGWNRIFNPLKAHENGTR